MIDLNTLISNALTAAVQQATAPLNEQIAKLEAQSADQHQRLLVLEGALTDRVVALEEKVYFLEDQAVVTSNRIHDRIAALENNPAQGVDMTLEQRVAALESETQSENRYLSRDDVAELIAEAMDDHTSSYDHDDYDSAVSKLDDLPDLDDYVTRDELRSEIEDVLNNATLSLSI